MAEGEGFASGIARSSCEIARKFVANQGLAGADAGSPGGEDSTRTALDPVQQGPQKGPHAGPIRQQGEWLRWPDREHGLTERDLELAHGGAFTQADVEAAFAHGRQAGEAPRGCAMKIHVRHEIAAVALPSSQLRNMTFRTDCLEVREVDGKPTAIATNGRALAFVPVELHADDKPGVYPAEAFAAARQSYQEECDPEMAFPRSRYIDEAQVELHLVGDGVARVLRQVDELVDAPGGPRLGSRRVQTTTVASTEWRAEGSTKFPDAVSLLEERRKRVATAQVTIDVNLLADLAKALGAPGVQLELHGRTGAVIVRPVNRMGALEEGIGLLMPIATDEDFEADKQAGGTL